MKYISLFLILLVFSLNLPAITSANTQSSGLATAPAEKISLSGRRTPVPTSTASPSVIVTAAARSTPMSAQTPLPSTYRDAVVANNPISYWRLGESSGSTASDLQKANNGTYTNTPTLGQPGALSGDPNSAVSFNGTTQYVRVPYNAALNPTTFSVEVWAKPTGGVGTYRGVIASRYYPKGWVLYAGANNKWQFWVNNGTGMLSVSGGPVTLNAWTHLVGTFDGTTVRLYVNGVLAGSGKVRAAYQPQTTQPLTIGQGEPGSGFFFPGSVDEAAVYGSVLSASQVQNDYLVGTTGSTATPTPTRTATSTPTRTSTPTPTNTPPLPSRNSILGGTTERDWVRSPLVGAKRLVSSIVLGPADTSIGPTRL